MKIGEDNPRLAHTFSYIETISGLKSCVNEKVKYYPLGDDMFADMLSAIKKAEKFIFVEYFIIEEGLMWNTMVDLLEEKAKSGVTVKVLYDDFGSLTTYSGKEVKKLWAMGIECVPFNPLIFIKGIGDAGIVNVEIVVRVDFIHAEIADVFQVLGVGDVVLLGDFSD